MPTGVTPKKKFDLSTWDGFSELPADAPDYLLDTTAINKKLADGKDNPYRWRVGSFQIPKGMSPQQREAATKEACKRFIGAFAKQGWELVSKLQVFGPYPAYDLASMLLMLDKEEVRIRGIFKIAAGPKPVRLELPSGSVKHHPGQTATLQEVMKAESMSPVPLNQRPRK